ncbi:MAG: hypothetical protein Q9164_002642 [Protoblastenia rupestris]
MDSKTAEKSLSTVLPWILLVLVFAYALDTLYKAYATPLRDIPGPWLAKFTRIWLFTAIAKRDFQTTNVDLHRKYGPIVRIAPNEYSIDDPEAAQEAHLFATTDIKHHAARLRQVKNLFQLGPLMKIEYHIDDMMTVFLEKMKCFAAQDQIIDLAEWFQLFSFDTIGCLTFGKPFGVLEEGGDIADIIAIIHSVVRYGAPMGVFHEWNPLIFRLLQLFGPKGAVGIAYVEQFTTKAIEQWSQQPEKEKQIREEEGEGGDSLTTDILGSLLAKHRSSPEKFTIADAYYHVIPSVLAGGHTTGISLAATMHSLMGNPRVLSKLRRALEELTVDSRNGLLSMKQTQDCKYLQAVIKESLRLFPATGNPLSRVVPKGGLEILGRKFPEGVRNLLADSAFKGDTTYDL